MTIDDIAIAAFNGTFPDEPMNMPEMLLYREIENISLKYKYGIITKDVATTLKTKAQADYKHNLTAYQNGIDCAHRIADLYKRIELDTSAYRLERKKVEELSNEIVLIPTEVQNVDKLVQLYKTIENADKILEVIYG